MFKSVHDALSFAFRVVGCPIVKMSSINSMRGSSGHGSMTPHDRHAQAVIVLEIVDRALDVNAQACIRAHYGHELRGGEGEKAVEAVLVRMAMFALPTGMHSRRGVAKIVRMYFGQDISMISARKDLQCNNRRYYEYRQAIHDALHKACVRADDEAYRALEAAGLILLEQEAA